MGRSKGFKNKVPRRPKELHFCQKTECGIGFMEYRSQGRKYCSKTCSSKEVAEREEAHNPWKTGWAGYKGKITRWGNGGKPREEWMHE